MFRPSVSTFQTKRVHLRRDTSALMQLRLRGKTYALHAAARFYFFILLFKMYIYICIYSLTGTGRTNFSDRLFFLFFFFTVLEWRKNLIYIRTPTPTVKKWWSAVGIVDFSHNEYRAPSRIPIGIRICVFFFTKEYTRNRYNR